MQIEVYNMQADSDALTITLEAICDTFSSLLWDIEHYQCGCFEVYIAANPQNIAIFQTGRIVGRDDDNQHFSIIESVHIDTDLENGDYLTVSGRFLMCLLERRIIHLTYLDRYEVYVDADDISEEEQVEGETRPIPEEEYIELLKTRGSEKLVQPQTASESTIAANSTQYQYNRDYAVGYYVTVEHKRFGMMQPKIQLIGMVEGFDQNGRSLTPTFKEV